MQVTPKKFLIYGPAEKDAKKLIADNGVAPSSAKDIAEGLRQAGVPEENIVVSHDMGKLLDQAGKASAQLRAGEAEAGKLTLVMPGGIAPVIQDGIKPTPTGKLRTMLKEGHLDYVGVCAGCYLAAQKWANKGKSQPMLGLVAGLPTVERRVMDKALPAGQFPSEQLRLKWDGSDGPREVRWHGGPRFEEEDEAEIPGYKVLAHAADSRLGDNAPAVVTMKSGQGKVTLSSVHPEYPLSNEGPGAARDKRIELFRMVFGLPPQEG